MKSLTTVILITLFFTSCKEIAKQKSNETPTTEIEQTTVGNHLNSPLNWVGIYKGTLPCADCEGIEIEMTLNKDMTFTSKSTYLGKEKENKFEDKGSFEWDTKSTKIKTLTSDKSETKYYLIGERTLTMLNSDGKLTEGEFAKMYVLNKTKTLTPLEISGTYATTSSGNYNQTLKIVNTAPNQYDILINFSGATKGCTFKGKAKQVANTLLIPLAEVEKGLKGTMTIEFEGKTASVFTTDFEDRYSLNYFCGGGASLAGDYIKSK